MPAAIPVSEEKVPADLDWLWFFHGFIISTAHICHDRSFRFPYVSGINTSVGNADTFQMKSSLVTSDPIDSSLIRDINS